MDGPFEQDKQVVAKILISKSKDIIFGNRTMRQYIKNEPIDEIYLVENGECDVLNKFTKQHDMWFNYDIQDKKLYWIPNCNINFDIIVNENNLMNITKTTKRCYCISSFDCLEFDITEIQKIIIRIAFRYQLILFGGAVRDMLASKEPKDFDIAYHNLANVEQYLSALSDWFYITIIRNDRSKYYGFTMIRELTFKADPSIIIKIDFVDANTIGKSIDLDINSLCLTDKILFTSLDTDIDLILDNIKMRMFKVLQETSDVKRFIKLHVRINKMVKRGWMNFEESTSREIKKVFPDSLFVTSINFPNIRSPKIKYLLKIKLFDKVYDIEHLSELINDKKSLEYKTISSFIKKKQLSLIN